MAESPVCTTPRPSRPSPQDLTRQAIDQLSAALLELQLAMRQLPEDDPAIEPFRYAVTQLTDAGAALFTARERLAS